MAGLGADYQTYALAAAEIARHCGATALTWNMHVCSTLWAGTIADDLEMDNAARAEHERRRAIHFRRIAVEGAIYAQPFSEGNASAVGPDPVRHRGATGRGRLAGDRAEDLRFAVGACRLLRGAVRPRSRRMATHRAAILCIWRCLPMRRVSRVTGEWDPLGMRGTVSRNSGIRRCVRRARCRDHAARRVFPGRVALAAHVPDAVRPTYLGLAQAAYDFTVRYLRGEIPGAPPGKRRSSAVKQLAVAEMRIKLEQAKALWFQAVSEARVDPTPEQRLRAYAAQFSTMETANDLARLAIRTCGGHSMFRSLPLERIYRDSRCGSLMAPWTAEVCLERIGRGALYQEGETDD